MAFDSAGALYFVTSTVIKRRDPSGAITTFAGPFSAPAGIAVDAAGNVYVSDVMDHVVRKITPSGTVTILAGVLGSAGWAAGPVPGVLNRPFGLAIYGRDLYIAMGTAIAVVRNVQ
jgi:hypothetical protein